MARVLVTRAEPGASKTAGLLSEAGHEPILSPLLSIERIDASIEVVGVQALLFTSAAGVRAVADHGMTPLRPVVCVGATTAVAAQEAGFTDLRVALGDGAELAALVRAQFEPNAGALAHFAGEDVAFDLAAALEPDGFRIERRVVYRARKAEAFTTPARAALHGSEPALDAVLFHSARAVDTFFALAPPDATRALDALCLSARIAARAGEAAWRSIKSAERPNEALLFALLRRSDSAQS